MMGMVRNYNYTVENSGDGSLTGKNKKTMKTKMSSKGQVVIPKTVREKIHATDFFVECDGDIIKLIPVYEEDRFFDFTGDLVRELVDNGYSGEKLKEELEKRKEMLDNAFTTWIDEVENDDSGLVSTEEVRRRRRRK